MREATIMAVSVLITALPTAACRGGSEPTSDGSTRDAASEGPSDAGSEPCPDGRCGLRCAPTDVWFASSATSAGDPALADMGDADPATPEEVGDGQYHLFVGVNHEDVRDGCDHGVVFIHDAVADRPEGPYRVPPTPVTTGRDSHDHFGIETPSYVRADERTEYLYYCGLSACNVGAIGALRRLDGGTWEKIGLVAPLGPGSTSQCEPDVVRDPATDRFYMYFIANGDRAGVLVRSSDDPTHFPVDGERLLVPASEGWGARPAVNYDSVERVWRFVGDVGGYTVENPPTHSVHSWATSPVPNTDTLLRHQDVVHAATHPTDLHPGIHVNGGLAYQVANAIYLDDGDVLFFFSGYGRTMEHSVFWQRCSRL